MVLELLLTILSTALIFAASLRMRTSSRLINRGKKAEAIVLGNTRFQKVFYPTVKFLNDTNEWVTQRLPIATVYRIERGTKVLVICIPDDRETIEIFSTFRLIILPRLLLVSGITGVAFSILDLRTHSYELKRI